MTSPESLDGRLVFVVGAPRSGTTWLQRMLSVHPDVLSVPSETHVFSSGLSVLRDRTQGTLVDSIATATWFMPQPEFNAAARAFADACFQSFVRRRNSHAKRIVERSPTHVWHLGLINALYPDAYVLHIVRDGRDVVRSQVAQTWGPADLELASAQWASSVRAARAAAPSISRYLEVGYEALLAQPRRIVDVFGFLGLPVTDDILDLSLIEGGLEVNVDPNRPDVATQKWRVEWTARDVDVFEAVAGDALDLLGYERLPSLIEEPAPGPLASRRLRDRRAPGQRPSLPAVAVDVRERMQQTITEVLGAMDGSGSRDLTVEVSNAKVEVRVSAADVDWRALGRTAVQRLAAHLHAEGPWGDPLRGEQVISGNTWTLVLTHRRGDGRVVDRVVIVTLDPAKGVESLRYYRLPFIPHDLAAT